MRLTSYDWFTIIVRLIEYCKLFCIENKRGVTIIAIEIKKKIKPKELGGRWLEKKLKTQNLRKINADLIQSPSSMS